jgi:hypothetical protein
MATEVEKFSVFDPRIIQTRPKYAVEKGALSVSNVSFQAQTADVSSCQFNVQVPSENVFVDRAVEWNGTQVATVVLAVTAGTLPDSEINAGTSLQGLVAPAAFPLHQSTSQMSATINDATVTVNTQDVLPQVLRLSDMRDARRQRTCPTMLDRYAKYPDSSAVPNSPLQSWAQTTASDDVPNGGFNGFYYATDATGATPVDVTNAAQVVGEVTFVYGQPTLRQDLATGVTRAVTLYVCWNSVEKLLLPPFIFSDQYEMSTGLFGVQNFQVQMNLVASPARAVRVSNTTTLPQVLTASGALLSNVRGSVALTSVAWGNGAFAGMWVTKPTLSVQFLTPSLDVPLPPKSIVPYMEFPRYIATPGTPIIASTSLNTAGTDLQSQTITLPNIPDLLVIYVKPASYTDSTNGDWSLPITSISMNFDNFSGLLSTMTQEQLYQMSLRNGVDMDWSEWSGFAALPLSGAAAGLATQGGVRGLVGGPLVLKPGVDFPLSSGQASGLVGNFTLQFNLKVQNFTGAAVTPNIYTVPISSGFFETIKGSSRIIKGVLTEQDILSAPAQAPSAELQRPVGAGRMPSMGKVSSRVMGGARSSMGAYM